MSSTALFSTRVAEILLENSIEHFTCSFLCPLESSITTSSKTPFFFKPGIALYAALLGITSWVLVAPGKCWCKGATGPQGAGSGRPALPSGLQGPSRCVGLHSQDRQDRKSPVSPPRATAAIPTFLGTGLLPYPQGPQQTSRSVWLDLLPGLQAHPRPPDAARGSALSGWSRLGNTAACAHGLGLGPSEMAAGSPEPGPALHLLLSKEESTQYLKRSLIDYSKTKGSCSYKARSLTQSARKHGGRGQPDLGPGGTWGMGRLSEVPPLKGTCH